MAAETNSQTHVDNAKGAVDTALNHLKLIDLRTVPAHLRSEAKELREDIAALSKKLKAHKV